MGFKSTNKFVCRIPNRSIDDYCILEDDVYTMNEYIKQKISDKYIQLAIYLASPTLYAELEAFQDENYYKTLSAKKLKSIYCSFISYINRLSTRATPFGLFSSIFCGEADNSINNYSNIGNVRLAIEFDGRILHKIAEKLIANQLIKENTIFYTNNTFFKFDEKLYYIEFNEKEKRDFYVSSLKNSQDLQEILSYCTDGKTYNELFNYLKKNNYNPSNVITIIDFFIDNKVLISELEPDVIGRTYHQQIFSFIQKNEKFVNPHLKNAFQQLSLLSINNISLEQLEGIKKELDYIITTAPHSYFNINSFSDDRIVVNSSISDNVENGFKYFLSYYTKIGNESREISSWKHHFLLKFDGKFVKLKMALDPEAGCYYGTNLNMEGFDSNFLIDKLPINNPNSKKSLRKNFDAIDSFIMKETIKCIKDNRIEVILPNELLESNLDYNAFPLTVNAFCQIGMKEENAYIHYRDVITDSATTLLGRFTPYDKNIKNLCDNLAEWEQTKLSSCMLCEFSHVMTYEDCNITSRDIDRKYIIPYLSHASGNVKTEVLNFDDIYVGIYEERIVFFDSKKKKQIIPVISHSQNYSKELLPIYKFIGDVQMYNSTYPKYCERDNSYLKKIFGFEPRIRYGNYYFSLAKWIVESVDIRDFFSQDLYNRIEKFKEYLLLRNIPMEFLIVSGDMKLYVNMMSLPVKSIILIEKCITNKNFFEIEEFFYSDHSSIIKQKNQSYAAEYIFPFKNIVANYVVNSKKDNDYIYEGLIAKKQRVFLPNDEWVYFKVYCEYSISDKIISNNLIDIENEAFMKSLIDKWHFLRYKDLQGHQIRIRYHLKNPSFDNISQIYELVKKSLSPFTIDEIPTIKIDTYTRELERYGVDIYEEIENIFCIDSNIHCNLLKILMVNNEQRILFGLYIIKRYINMVFHLPQDQLTFVQTRIQELGRDYKGGKEQRVYFNQKFHSIAKIIEKYFEQMDQNFICNKFDEIEKIYVENKISDEILPLLIHMSLDRLYKSRNRLNEYAAYSLMERYYKKILFQSNS